jgi:hypothetical protein
MPTKNREDRQAFGKMRRTGAKWQGVAFSDIYHFLYFRTALPLHNYFIMNNGR